MVKDGRIGIANQQNEPEPCRCIIGTVRFEPGNQICGYAGKVGRAVKLQAFHILQNLLLEVVREGVCPPGSILIAQGCKKPSADPFSILREGPEQGKPPQGNMKCLQGRNSATAPKKTEPAYSERPKFLLEAFLLQKSDKISQDQIKWAGWTSG